MIISFDYVARHLIKMSHNDLNILSKKIFISTIIFKLK